MLAVRFALFDASQNLSQQPCILFKLNRLYDSQARIAVESKDGDLQSYYENWLAEFENHKEEIQSVCKKLSGLSLYAVDQRFANRPYIDEISSSKWFHERVFDIYLWSKGSNA